MGEIFANQITDKELMSRIYKEVLHLNNKTQITQLESGQDI
jgi:hypothetical protein